MSKLPKIAVSLRISSQLTETKMFEGVLHRLLSIYRTNTMVT